CFSSVKSCEVGGFCTSWKLRKQKKESIFPISQREISSIERAVPCCSLRMSPSIRRLPLKQMQLREGSEHTFFQIHFRSLIECVERRVVLNRVESIQIEDRHPREINDYRRLRRR
ncbi:hypothetical protein PFISCL1PPCAC_23914, partial [Pristionchus fissidentatus]